MSQRVLGAKGAAEGPGGRPHESSWSLAEHVEFSGTGQDRESGDEGETRGQEGRREEVSQGLRARGPEDRRHGR